MKNKWKILCGIVTISATLVAAGCGPSLTDGIKDALSEAVQNANIQAVAENESGNNDSFNLLGGGEQLNFDDSEEDADVEIAPADLAILNEMPDILRGSDLPKRGSYSRDTDVCVTYFDQSIPGYMNIACFDDGRTEIEYYSDDGGSMAMAFYRPSGTYLSYSVRGITRDNCNAPVIGGYDIAIDGSKFAELSKDFYKNSSDYSIYYGDFDFSEELGTYQDNLYTIFARFGTMSNAALGELGLTWDDLGVNFGEEYKKYDALATLPGTVEKVPMLMEKQTFTDGVSDTTGKTWIETVHDGIMKQATYNSREGEEPTDWFAYNEARSNNFIDSADYVQIETYDDENTFMAFYHSGGYEDEDRYASRVFFITFFEDETVSIRYMYETDFSATNEPGVISSDVRMGFSVLCEPGEIKDIFASEDSLKAAIEKPGCTYYEESEYMSNDEMIADFMSNYASYMSSIDDNIKTMGTCMADYGIEY